MTLQQLVTAHAARLEKAGVCFGQGTLNAHDEAAWLTLWALGLPLDGLDEAAGDEVAEADAARASALIERRIQTRLPSAYLTGEAWLQGVPFFVDERTIVPRSFIAELIADASFDAWLGRGHPPRARPVHRQRQPCRAGGNGLARDRRRRGGPVDRRPWRSRGATSTATISPAASAWSRATAWPPCPAPTT